MMRAVVSRAAGSSQQRELPAVAVTAVRHYLAPSSIAFTEEVGIAKPAIKGDGASVLDTWKAQAAETAQLLKLLQTYKEIGDSKAEPFLKFHNPRTFEDLSKPVPNFRTMNLKAGEVPKFFDTVLSARATDAVSKKTAWWTARKAEAEDSAKLKTSGALPSVPVPAWTYGKSVPLSQLSSVTDKYIKSLEPARKLALAPLPATVKDSLASYASALGQPGAAAALHESVLKALAEKAAVVDKSGKPIAGFTYVSKAVAAKVLAARRAEVHDKYVKHWAKKLLVSPELAAVPLKSVDAQLASKFEGVAPEYAELLTAAGSGAKTLAEKVAASPAFSSFFLKRETAASVATDLPATEVETQGAALAAKLDDPEAALKQLLGPELHALGAAGVPLSAQVRAITEHKYTPDRYLYKEGMALAARLEKEEAAAKAAGVDPLHPPSPVQQVLEHIAKSEGARAELVAELAGTDNPYTKDVVAKKQAFLAEPSNLALEEILYPEISAELLDLELSELAELEASIIDAEEEELWSLTLSAYLKHLQAHFGVDLPHGVIAHMDPILFKKIDWETSANLEDWDISLEDLGSEYAREQWGLETLSHHLLPLLRYRRAKARARGEKFDPELSAPVR